MAEPGRIPYDEAMTLSVHPVHLEEALIFARLHADQSRKGSGITARCAAQRSRMVAVARGERGERRGRPPFALCQLSVAVGH